MEVTSIIRMEITQIEDGKDDKHTLPFGAESKDQLPEIIRAKLGCDNVVIKGNVKQFSIDKGEWAKSKKGGNE